MARTHSLILLAVAILLGLVAALGASSYLRPQANAETAPERPALRLIAARVPLAFGDTITPEKVHMIDWPAGSVPDGALQSLGDLGGNQRVALFPIAPNELVLTSKISGADGRGGLAAMIPSDKRAATIRIDDVTGVAGFARPGDTVDVVVTRQIDQDRRISDVLLQNVRIIALDQTPQNDGEGEKPAVSKTATLEVSQREAQLLALGQQAGALSLVLRNVADQVAAPAQTVRISDLRWGGGAELPVNTRAVAAAPAPRQPAIARPAAPRQPGPSVEIVRGVESKSYSVGQHD